MKFNAVGTSAVLLFASVFSTQVYADKHLLPDGYQIVDLATDWIKGSTQPDQCAALANARFPGKPFQILSSHESHKFLDPLLRRNSRYMYFCKLLIKTD